MTHWPADSFAERIVVGDTKMRRASLAVDDSGSSDRGWTTLSNMAGIMVSVVVDLRAL